MGIQEGSVVVDNDRGYRALVARIFGAAARKTHIDVGVLEPSASQAHGVVSVIEVAVWNEFGTANIPARSFIRGWFDENEGAIRQQLVALMQSVVLGKRTKEEILEILGQWCVGQIQARIAEGIEPPNAPSTVKAKGSSTPLIDTGTLRSSISYRVTEDR